MTTWNYVSPEANGEPSEPLTLEDKLLQEAEAEDRAAASYDGCMWLGKEHPSMPHRRRASLLRQAAAELIKNKKKAKPKKTKP